MSYRIWAILFGLYIWVQATITIRLGTDLIFKPDDLGYMAIVFAVTGIAVYGAGIFFYRLFSLSPFDRATAGILICAVGLLADMPVAIHYKDVFPDMTPEQFSWFVAWVIWGYGVGILTGIWPKNLPGLPKE